MDPPGHSRFHSVCGRFGHSPGGHGVDPAIPAVGPARRGLAMGHRTLSASGCAAPLSRQLGVGGHEMGGTPALWPHGATVARGALRHGVVPHRALSARHRRGPCGRREEERTQPCPPGIRNLLRRPMVVHGDRNRHRAGCRGSGTPCLAGPGGFSHGPRPLFQLASGIDSGKPRSVEIGGWLGAFPPFADAGP
jgi:hypothetical protein